MNSTEITKGEIVMYQPDETFRLEVRMGEETVWLTQQQMADLFATDRTSIAKHIQNIYQTDELKKDPTCAKIAQVRQEGKRKVKRNIVYYNLDMIISVGYRVNSIRGTKFRQWANRVLKDYLLRGYVVDTRRNHPHPAQQAQSKCHCHHLYSPTEPATAVGRTAPQPAVPTYSNQCVPA